MQLTSHWQYGGATNKFSAFCSLISFGFGGRITPSYRINNGLLYFYSAMVPGWTFNEYRHIANALTLCETLAPNQNHKKVNGEKVFKKKRTERKYLRRGYVFAFVSSLLISGGQAGRYHFFLRSAYLRRTNIFLINWALLFILFFIVTFLLARWYYRMKDKQNKVLRSIYWNE